MILIGALAGLGLGLSFVAAPLTVKAPTGSALAVLHIAAFLGGPLLLGWAVAAAAYPTVQWPALAMLVVSGPALLLFAAEVGSRLTDNYGLNGWEAVLSARQEPRVWRGQPGQRREFVNTVHLNRWGFHDAEPPPIRDRPRVLLIGDSQLAAASEPRHATTSARLRELCPRVDIVAIAWGGWGARDHHRALVEWSDSVAPDIVLIGHYSNDISDSSDTIRAERRRIRGAFEPIMRFLRRHRLQVPGLALHFVRGVLDQRAFGPDRFREPTSDIWREAWQSHERMVTEISEWAAREDVALAWWGVPSRAIQENGWDAAGYPYDRHEEIVESLGHDYLPLARRAADRPEESEPIHWPSDGHLNRAGHRFTADRLAKYLDGQGFPCGADPAAGDTRVPTTVG